MTVDDRDLSTPNGCRWCGVQERMHCWRWSLVGGRHQYEAPTDEQRLQRMRARAAKRQETTRG